MNLHDIDVIALIISHSRLILSPLPYTIHNESELQVPCTYGKPGCKRCMELLVQHFVVEMSGWAPYA